MYHGYILTAILSIKYLKPYYRHYSILKMSKICGGLLWRWILNNIQKINDLLVVNHKTYHFLDQNIKHFINRAIVIATCYCYRAIFIIFLIKLVKFAFFVLAYTNLSWTFRLRADWKVKETLRWQSKHLRHVRRWTSIAFLTYPYLTRRIFLVNRASTCEHRNCTNLSKPSTGTRSLTSMPGRRERTIRLNPGVSIAARRFHDENRDVFTSRLVT